MCARSVIAAMLVTLGGCQLVGGIEERPYVKKERDGGAVTSEAGVDATVAEAREMCADGGCTHEIAAGPAFTCARERDGRVRCWGANERGELGDESTEDRKDPVWVRGLGDATDIWAGSEHACARLTDGRVSCWGSNVRAELGDPEYTAYYRARPGIVPRLEGVLELALGDLHSCARTATAVLCWGSNSYGQAGRVLDDKIDAPMRVVGLGSDVVGIAAGGRSTCALRTDGAVLCWGDNSAGQLADGTRRASADPMAIGGLPPAKHVAMSSDRVCAVLRDGSVWCWGGASDVDAGAPPPPTPVDGVADAVEVALGGEHTCARTNDGLLVCWGYDLRGQLGRDRKGGGDPAPVRDLGEVSSFALGGSHSCARARGILYCWGFNNRGQLGDGSTTDQYVPTKVLDP